MLRKSIPPMRYFSTSVVNWTGRSKVKPMKPADYSTEKAAAHLATFKGGSISYARAENDVGVITIDHVARKNALTGKMMVDLHNVVGELERGDARHLRAIVLRGRDGNFCSGGDLTFVKQICTSEEGYLMCTFMGETLSRFAALPCVSIARIEGFALGGSSELASSCDIRVAQKDARVGFVQGRMGVSPGWGGAAQLVRALGTSRALELLATASVLRAPELQTIGFVQHVYEDDASFDAYLKHFSTLEVAAVQAAKRVIHALRPRDEAAFETERSIFASLWGGPLQAKALESGKKHK